LKKKALPKKDFKLQKVGSSTLSGPTYGEIMKISPKVKKIIEENALALASMMHNKPHIAACGYVKVVEHKIVISASYLKTTLRNIRRNPHVAIAVWNEDWKKKSIGYSLFGKAKFYDSGKWLDFVKNLEENKGMRIKGAIVIDVFKIKNLS